MVNQTKFPKHKVWWLREAAPNPYAKKSFKHSVTEFQSIQQFLQHKKKKREN